MAPIPARTHLALLAVQVLFGSWPVFGKLALAVMPGPALIGIRTAVATLVFFALRPRSGGSLGPRLHLQLALAGLSGVAVNQLLYIEGLRRSSAVNATVLTTTIPVF